MTREEFIALPPSIALGILWDASGQLASKLDGVVAPKPPRPPKYDCAIYRKDGVSWASEYDLDGLRYWRGKKAQSTDPKYAEKDAKTVKALDYWIQYRVAFPTEPWSGERNREAVTARAPSGKPMVYARDGAGRSQQSEPEPAAAPSFDDDVNDDDIPF